MMNICFQTTNELLKRERGNRPPSIIQWNYVNWTKMSIQEVRIYYDERDDPHRLQVSDDQLLKTFS